MKLIVGLGNPDRAYQRTRHNVGFVVLGELARRHGEGRPKVKFRGEVLEAMIGGQRTLLLSPLTYMNRSGMSVQEACVFFKLPLEDLLVVCDDFNLPLARLRIRAGGSAGGQKGLADIIQRLGTDEFPRLRVGIGLPPEGADAVDYVLGKFAEQEVPEIETAVCRAADAAACWVAEGVEECMSRYN